MLHTSPVPRGPPSHLWQPATSTSNDSIRTGSSSAPSPCTPSTTTSSPRRRAPSSACAISGSGSLTPVRRVDPGQRQHPGVRVDAVLGRLDDALHGRLCRVVVEPDPAQAAVALPQRLVRRVEVVLGRDRIPRLHAAVHEAEAHRGRVREGQVAAADAEVAGGRVGHAPVELGLVLAHVAGSVGIEPAAVALDRLADRARMRRQHERVEVADLAREAVLRLHRRPVARVVGGRLLRRGRRSRRPRRPRRRPRAAPCASARASAECTPPGDPAFPPLTESSPAGTRRTSRKGCPLTRRGAYG